MGSEARAARHKTAKAKNKDENIPQRKPPAQSKRVRISPARMGKTVCRTRETPAGSSPASIPSTFYYAAYDG